jgi:hypothetical protein
MAESREGSNQRSLLASLAIVGLAMVIIAAYVQWESMDLRRYPLSEYVEHDITSWSWWSVVGIPGIVGAGYLIGALIALSRTNGRRDIKTLFVTSFVVSLLILPIGGLGVFASITTGLLLLSAWWARRRRMIHDQ